MSYDGVILLYLFFAFLMLPIFHDFSSQIFMY